MDRKKRSPAEEKGENRIASGLCLERVICKHVLLRLFQKLISDHQQCPITLKYPLNYLITVYIQWFYFEKKNILNNLCFIIRCIMNIWLIYVKENYNTVNVWWSENPWNRFHCLPSSHHVHSFLIFLISLTFKFAYHWPPNMHIIEISICIALVPICV